METLNKTDNVAISIIIPVYNVEKSIHRCIDSIIQQEYRDFELVLVNDGSVDNSGTICDTYASQYEYIKVYHKNNGGVSAARNLGIEKSIGRWICFVDSDDWVESTYLNSFAKCVDTSISLDAICVQGIQYYIPDTNKFFAMFSYDTSNCKINETSAQYILNNRLLENGCPVAKLFSRNTIVTNNLRFNESISLNEDHLFVIDYYRYVKQIWICEETAYNYVYDYTLPSLTKIKHSSAEYLNISRLMTQSFMSLKGRFDAKCDAWNHLYSTLGLGQILRAALASCNSKHSYQHIKECYNEWLSNKDLTINFTSKDTFEQTLAFLFSHNMVLTGFIYSHIVYAYRDLRRRISVVIKNLLR